MPETPRFVKAPKRTSDFIPIEVIGQRRKFYDDIYHWVLTLSWTQFFLVVAGAFLAANAVFAAAYAMQRGSLTGARSGSFEDAFFFSVQTMATIGYGGMAPATRFAHVMVTLEALLGVLGIALVTGITFAKFARPTAQVLFSDKAVICPRNGVPHLMFRMANFRHNQVVEAQLRVILLVLETTREGETLRRPIELPLVRDRTALFTLTWVAMHVIDEKSPFHGPDAFEKLRAVQGELFLSLLAHDDTVSQTIHARHRYALDDIAVGARFGDVLTILPGGLRRVDYTHFHEIVPIPESSGRPPLAEAPKDA